MNKTTEALKLAEEALVGFTTSFRTPVDDVLVVIREALAEQDKQEPVAIVTTRFTDNYLAWDKAIPPAGTKLYAAPVDAKAIRAEALEEAAKACDAVYDKYPQPRIAATCAAVIRGLK